MQLKKLDQDSTKSLAINKETLIQILDDLIKKEN